MIELIKQELPKSFIDKDNETFTLFYSYDNEYYYISYVNEITGQNYSKVYEKELVNAINYWKEILDKL